MFIPSFESTGWPGTAYNIRTRILAQSRIFLFQNLVFKIFVYLYDKILSMDIRNKVAIITGASASIGLATAKLFAKNGVKVALAARSKDKLNKLASDYKTPLLSQLI